MKNIKENTEKNSRLCPINREREIYTSAVANKRVKSLLKSLIGSEPQFAVLEAMKGEASACELRPIGAPENVAAIFKSAQYLVAMPSNRPLSALQRDGLDNKQGKDWVYVSDIMVLSSALISLVSKGAPVYSGNLQQNPSYKGPKRAQIKKEIKRFALPKMLQPLFDSLVQSAGQGVFEEWFYTKEEFKNSSEGKGEFPEMPYNWENMDQSRFIKLQGKEYVLPHPALFIETGPRAYKWAKNKEAAVSMISLYHIGKLLAATDAPSSEKRAAAEKKWEKERAKKVESLITDLPDSVKMVIPGMFLDGLNGTDYSKESKDGCVDEYWSKIKGYENLPTMLQALMTARFGLLSGVAGKTVLDLGQGALRQARLAAARKSSITKTGYLKTGAKVIGLGAAVYFLYETAKDYAEYTAKDTLLKSGATGKPSEAIDTGIVTGALNMVATGLKAQANDRCFWMFFTLGAVLLSPKLYTRGFPLAARMAYQGGKFVLKDVLYGGYIAARTYMSKASQLRESVDFLNQAKSYALLEVITILSPAMTKFTKGADSLAGIFTVVSRPGGGYELVFTAEALDKIQNVGFGFSGWMVTKLLDPAIDWTPALGRAMFLETKAEFELLRVLLKNAKDNGRLHKVTNSSGGHDYLLGLDATNAINRLKEWGEVLETSGRKLAAHDHKLEEAQDLLTMVLKSKNASNLLNDSATFRQLMNFANAKRLLQVFEHLHVVLDALAARNQKIMVHLAELSILLKRVETTSGGTLYWNRIGAFHTNLQNLLVAHMGEGMTIERILEKAKSPTELGRLVNALNPKDLKKLIEELNVLVDTAPKIEGMSDDVRIAYEALRDLRDKVNDSSKVYQKYIVASEETAHALSLLLKAEATTIDNTVTGAKAIERGLNSKQDILNLHKAVGGQPMSPATGIHAMIRGLVTWPNELLKMLARASPEIQYWGSKFLGATPVGLSGWYGWSKYNQEKFKPALEQLQGWASTDKAKADVTENLKGIYESFRGSPDDFPSDRFAELTRMFNGYKGTLTKDNQAIKERNLFVKHMKVYILDVIEKKIEAVHEEDKNNKVNLLVKTGTEFFIGGLSETNIGERERMRSHFLTNLEKVVRGNQIKDFADFFTKFLFLYHRQMIFTVLENSSNKVNEVNRKELKKLVKEVLNENSGLGYSPMQYYDNGDEQLETDEDISSEFRSFLQHYDRDQTNKSAISLAKGLCSTDKGLNSFREMLELIQQLPELQREIVLILRNNKPT